MIAFLRNLFFHDFWLKLFSLVLAVLIWFTVSLARSGGVGHFFTSRKLPERTFVNVPVSVICPAAEVREFKVTPSEVDITVQGENKLLQGLKIREIRASVDLTGIESVRGLRKRIEITTPTGIIFVRVAPDEVEVIVPPKR
jgi:YbbR domain-containing protein